VPSVLPVPSGRGGLATFNFRVSGNKIPLQCATKFPLAKKSQKTPKHLKDFETFGNRQV